MKSIRILTFLLILTSFQTSYALCQDDEDCITNIINDYVDAWNNHSGRGFADHFAPDSDFINIFGMHFRGKEAIQERHDAILDTFLKGSTFTITDLALREVNPNLVMAFVRWKVEGFHKPGSDQNGPEETSQGIFSHVFINDTGEWEITATQNTLSN